MKGFFKGRIRSPLPGFGLTLGFTLAYLSLLVIIPLAGIFLTTAKMSPAEFWHTVSSPRVLASFRVTFGCALAAALINGVFGFLTAWVLVRYPLPGRKIVDALVDLPFALPTAVAGITLAGLFSSNGWIGRILAPLGIKIAYTPRGIVLALVFIGLPFVVRTVQPVLEDFDREIEEAAACLGADRWRTFLRVILPTVFELKGQGIYEWLSSAYPSGMSGNVVAAGLTSIIYVIGIWGQYLGGRAAERYDPRWAYLVFHGLTLPPIFLMAMASDMPLVVLNVVYFFFRKSAISPMASIAVRM